MRTIRNIRGVTLVELLTVVAILGFMAIVLGFSFQGWLAKYKVEDETKRLYADLTDARARAMQKKRMTFVDLAATQYQVYEDSDPAPDGDGTLGGSDRLVSDSVTTGGLPYPIDLPTLGGVTQIGFDKEGVAVVLNPVTIRFVSDLSPDYDCITVFRTRLRIGRYNGGACQEQ